jgi:pyruvate/2-oxoglutarate dehydrogenase complex dihydrolipoamide dehydrogenase (E3) component
LEKALDIGRIRPSLSAQTEGDAMAEAKHYDAIVIGAGQSGGPLSTALARAGLKSALIEREHVGGTCINYGCTPTKTMVASARAAYMARRGADYGVQTGAVSVDMKKIRQRKRDIVQMFRGGSQKRIEKTEGVDLIFGEASFTGPKTIRVKINQGGTVQFSADRFFINTGTRPLTPPIDGIDKVPTLDNTSSVLRRQVLHQHRHPAADAADRRHRQGSHPGQHYHHGTRRRP